jgi:hypothetical protein
VPNFVQLYRSTDLNAPVLTGQVGKLTDLMYAVLVTGYTTASVTSITESGTTYTVTIAVSNSTLNTGNYVTIAGCTGGFTALNGTWQITVTSNTTFTFVGPGSLGTPATGTITYCKAGLGWSRPSLGGTNPGTNVMVFQPASVTGRTNQFYYRMDDNSPNATPAAREACVRGYVSMSDLSTGTEPFPTVAQHAAPGPVFRKSTSADATARPWYVIGDGATVYIVMNSDNSTTAGRFLLGFGGFISDVTADAYNSFVGGAITSNSGTPSSGNGGMAGVVGLSNSTIFNTMWVPRTYTQLGTSVAACCIQPWNMQVNGMGQVTSMPFPYPMAVDGGLYVGPIICAHAGLAIRGKMPGMYSHMHQTAPGNEGDQITTVTGLSGVTLRMVNTVNASVQCWTYFDEFGPW